MYPQINSLAVKEKVWPCSKYRAGVKKLWNPRGWPRIGCDNGIGWWSKLITIIQVNLYCLILTSLEISTKFTWIVVIKIFAINLYYHSHFLATPLISQLFSHWPFWTGPHLFFTARLFLNIYYFFLYFNLCFFFYQQGLNESSWCLRIRSTECGWTANRI